MVERYNFAFTVKPAEDVPGQWLAHCLDIDVMTQGNSLLHAVRMLFEAVVMVAMADREVGQDLRDRKPAPEEDWAAFWSVLTDGERVEMRQMLDKPDTNVLFLAGNLLLEFRDKHTEPKVPAAWEIEASRRSNRIHCHA
ncbi:hypothetical protein WMF31_02815 [Sorangium sp. So ce1036]|uniref:hypothetical protein n=1 Tax=Sorangium sp. So ce1036 TaxID=3133328 RepID=UPI003F0B3BC5